MKFKRILMGIISSTIACGVFAASEWKIIFLNSSFSLSIDTNSITNVSEYNYRQNKQFWVKQFAGQDLERYGLGVGDYKMVLYWINCSANTLGVKAFTDYKKQKDGTFKPESFLLANYQVAMNPIIPESVGQSFVRHVCP